MQKHSELTCFNYIVHKTHEQTHLQYFLDLSQLQNKIEQHNSQNMEQCSLQVNVKSLSRIRLFATPWTVAYRLLRPWDFPGKNTGVGCHCFLKEIFPTQGLNPGLPRCRQTLYHLSHQGSPLSMNLEFSVQYYL